MGRQGRRSLFPLPIVPRTLSMFGVHVLSGAYYPGTVLIFLLGYPAGTSAEERAFLGVRHKLLLNRAVKSVDQSQHTSRSGKCTLDLEKIRARLSSRKDQKGLESFYPRVNCLKTIPFTAAHTYIAHIWQYPPPPGVKTLYF